MRVLGLVLCWAWAASVAWCGPATPIGAASAPVTKVVRQYALTSANDFPQRDPRDWQLMGSNDGGQTWTTLDVRYGEMFSEPHQRRVFVVAKPAAFNLYRLQIDRVRDPSGADSVQLAEIEAMGATEDDLDPTPTAWDSITAQGDKFPVEIAYNAFDGQIETKWLDFAAQNRGTRASWIQWQYANPGSVTITNLEQLSKLRARASQGYEVRIEGVVAGRLSGNQGVWFLDSTGSLAVPGVAAGDQVFPGQRVLLEGTSQWINKQAGIGQPRLQLQGAKAATEPTPVTLEQAWSSREELQWVQVEGVAAFRARVDDRVVFELEDGDRSVSVHVLEPVPAGELRLPEGRIRVRGLGEGVLGQEGARELGILWVPSLGEVVPLAPASLAANPAASLPSTPTNVQAVPLLTEISKIRRLSRKQLAAGPRVKIRGVAIFGDYIQQGTEGIETWRGEEATQLGQHFVGDYVEAEDNAVWVSGHGAVIKADRPSPIPRLNYSARTKSSVRGCWPHP